MGRRLLLTSTFILGLVASASAGTFAVGDPTDTNHLQLTYQGGMPTQPTITSLKTVGNLVTLTWSGYSDPTKPFQVQAATSANSNAWVTVTNTFAKSVTLPLVPNQIFRINNPAPVYVGAQVCGYCHLDTHKNWSDTVHASAYESIRNLPAVVRTSCLPCHTVGYGSPNGFKDIATTPQFAGVQCENCHGPGGAHVTNVRDPLKFPKVELSGKLCGGCHTDSHHPTYDEYSEAGHSVVTADVAGSLVDPPGGTNRMISCGGCHSGAVRLGMLDNKPFPSGDDARRMAITCAVCHDSHTKTANGHQLRNPVFSTNFFNYNTSSNLAAQYNPNLQLCAQCHNGRGAAYNGTSRPPHHSPQYNILVGNLGVWATSNSVPEMSPHWTITNQCVGCHMQKVTVTTPTELAPNNTGHRFKPESNELCLNCHIGDTEWLDLLKEFTVEATKFKIQEVKSNLVLWATTKASYKLQTNGSVPALAWEFTTPGQLSPMPTNWPTGKAWVGPSAGNQTATNGVPKAIMEARFNLYLVEHDGSYGVHNNAYARYLLKVANDRVKAELAR
jgi:hypothetical protein